MTTQSANIILNAEARDRASATMDKVGLSIQGVQKNALAAARTFLNFSTIASAVGLSSSALIATFRGMMGEMQEANRAAVNLESRMRLMGFSTQAATSAVDSFRNSLSRTTFTSLRGMSNETARLIGLMDEDMRQSVADMTQQLEDLGFDGQEAFKAVTEAITGNMGPLNELGVDADTYGEAVQKVNERHQEWKDDLAILPGLMENLSNVEIFKPGGFLEQVASGDFGDTILEAAGKILDWLGQGLSDGAGAIGSLLMDTVLSPFSGGDNGAAGSGQMSIAGAVGGLLGNVLGGVVDGIPGLMTSIRDKVREAFDSTVGAWWEETSTGLKDFWMDTWDDIAAFPGKLVDRVKTGAISIFNGAIDVINWGIEQLNKLSIDLPDFLGGGTLGFNIDPLRHIGDDRSLGGLDASGLRGLPPAGIGPQNITIPIHIGDRKVDEVVVDAMDRQQRLREPGLGLA